MQRNRRNVETFQIRVQKAMRASFELIRQSNALSAQTTILVNRSEGNFKAMEFLPAEKERALLRRDGDSVLNWGMDAALQITNASMGNLQLFDRDTGALCIAVQRGFGTKFLDYFSSVHRGEAACGRALRTGATVVVEDVTESPVFQGTAALEVLLDAGVRAVQSTPLIGHAGSILGVISTHWPSPYRPRRGEVLELGQLARTLATWLELQTFI